MKNDIDSLADSERVVDPSCVYDDIESLPEWWRRHIEEFERLGLRPYQPSRFKDGVIVKEKIEELEAEYGVVIELKAKNPRYNGEREILVDGNFAATVKHKRKAEGYTQYGATSEEIEKMILDTLESDN